MALQAWFDDSSKTERPAFVLAGFVADADKWAGFSDRWRTVLDGPPKLDYFHAKEMSYLFRGWTEAQKETRLCDLVDTILDYADYGVTFRLRHDDYHAVFGPVIRRLRELQRTMKREERPFLNAYKNPYFISFLSVIGIMMHARASGPLYEIYFDEDAAEKRRLKAGFAQFVQMVERDSPEALSNLVTKEAEFRDDKRLLPLQAADLLAWHLRRHNVEAEKHAVYFDPVWRRLRKHGSLPYEDYWYTQKDLREILEGAITRAILSARSGIKP